MFIKRSIKRGVVASGTGLAFRSRVLPLVMMEMILKRGMKNRTRMKFGSDLKTPK